MTTKAKKSYLVFKFKDKDILLFGREISGAPDKIHKEIKDKIKIKLNKKARSLNVAIAAAIVSSEALRQIYHS